MAGLRLLVVDDDAIVGRVIMAAVRTWASGVVVASAAEAIALLERERFDAVVSDTDLGPGEPTGAWLLAEVARRWPDVRRVLISGQPQSTTEIFLRKPVTAAALRRALAGPALGGEPDPGAGPMRPPRDSHPGG